MLSGPDAAGPNIFGTSREPSCILDERIQQIQVDYYTKASCVAEFLLGRVSKSVEPLLGWFAQVLHGLGLKPDHITGLSFCCSLLSACAFAVSNGQFLPKMLGGGLLLLSGLFDAADGLVARLYAQESRFGAFLDSVLDRLSEIVIYWGVIYADLVGWSIGLIALSSSLMVSYSRARAEELGSEMKGVGIAERPERLLILAAATFVGQIEAGALLIILLSIITLLQRIGHARSTLGVIEDHNPELEAADRPK